MVKYSGNLKKIVGEGIATIRRQRDMTQEKFAEEASMSLSTLQKIESGARWPGVKILERILNTLNTTLGEVADFNSQAKPNHPKVMEQVKSLRAALALVEASVDRQVFREMERRARQSEPQARAYRALESHLGHELMERLKYTTREDIELLKATLPKAKARGVKKIQK